MNFLTPICIKSFVGWGFAADPTGGAYSAPPDSLSVFRGPTSKGRGGDGKEGVRPLPIKRKKSAPMVISGLQ